MTTLPKINILLNLPDNYRPKAEYVFRNLLNILGLNPQFCSDAQNAEVHIYYGTPSRRDYPVTISYKDDTSAFFEDKKPYPKDEVNFREYRGEMIPFLFSQGGDIYRFSGQKCSLNKDIIAGAFYFLSCWQEYAQRSGEAEHEGAAEPTATQTDIPEGRVKYAESLQQHWNFVEMPVVDIYAQILENAIKHSLPELAGRGIFVGEQSFTLALSHDIDYWKFWSKAHLLDTLKYNLKSFNKRPVNATYKLLGHSFHKTLFYSHYRLLENILKREEALGAKSTWFLMGKDDYPDERQNYSADPKTQTEILRLLGEKDVGLHGSPQAAFDLNTLKQEKQKLENIGLKIKGYRTHYLYFDYQKSFALLEDAGFDYDSTLGYWENIGFRCGTSFPFYPYNLAEDRAFRILEIPLVVMDTSLLSPKAMALNTTTARSRLRKMMTDAKKYNSHLTLLWHNTNFDPVDFPLWGDLYWDAIKHAQEHGAQVGSLSESYDKWSN